MKTLEEKFKLIIQSRTSSFRGYRMITDPDIDEISRVSANLTEQECAKELVVLNIEDEIENMNELNEVHFDKYCKEKGYQLIKKIR